MSKRKKILFAIIHMQMGGIEKSLINLLKELSKFDLYDIDVIAFSHYGTLRSQFEQFANVLPEDSNLRLIGVTQEKSKEYGMVRYCYRLISGVIAKYISQQLAYKWLMKNVKVTNHYDVAISFQNSLPNSLFGGTNEFILNKVSADKKITFIHGDMIRVGLDNKYNRKVYSNFDNIVTVSKSGEQLVISKWPEFQSKVKVVKNCIAYDDIGVLSEENINIKLRKINFVTVARLNHVKGFERTIDIFGDIHNKYKDFTWHIVGGGELMQILKDKILENGLEENIFLHGEQSNPYPYIKKCDAFILTSYHEAAPLVYSEANYLMVPILTTQTSSAIEMVADNQIGIVCENSEEGIKQMLWDVINNRKIIDDISKNMRKPSNKEAVIQFCNLIDN